MNDTWEETLRALEEKGLRRHLKTVDAGGLPRIRLNDTTYLNLASNNYLGFTHHPRLIAAAARALETYGAGAGASQLICGRAEVHADLEEALCKFKGVEAALVFSSGYAANVGVLTSLVGPRDQIFADKLNHASLIDGARLSRGEVHRYCHRDPDHLARLLHEHPGQGQRFIVSDGVFSMDGDIAPLPDLVALAEQHDAVLVLDDAHGTGVVGPGGKGTAAHFGLEDRVPVQIGTFSKALGAQGGFVAGSRTLIDFLVNRARSFIFSTGLAPASAAASKEALRVLEEEPDLLERLQSHLRRLREALLDRGYTLTGSPPAPMIAVIMGDPGDTLDLSAHLLDRGILAPAVRPPSVPEGTSRIRLAPMGTHVPEEIERVVEAFPMRRRPPACP